MLKERNQNLRTSALNDPERKGLLELLVERIDQLPEAPKKVLAMYYYEGSNLADIAACFNLTETQICQNSYGSRRRASHVPARRLGRERAEWTLKQ
jgi:DNA-directed RNA polymerase specialized sigma subunit